MNLSKPLRQYIVLVGVFLIIVFVLPPLFQGWSPWILWGAFWKVGLIAIIAGACLWSDTVAAVVTVGLIILELVLGTRHLFAYLLTRGGSNNFYSSPDSGVHFISAAANYIGMIFGLAALKASK